MSYPNQTQEKKFDCPHGFTTLEEVNEDPEKCSSCNHRFNREKQSTKSVSCKLLKEAEKKYAQGS